MPATYTLSTTTFASPVGKFDRQVKVASTSGLSAGMRLFSDRELMSVESLPGYANLVEVRRGVDGTAAQRHGTDATVYTGTPDKFFSFDPQGMPHEAVLVSPHINVLTGDVWFADGDTAPVGFEQRWWHKQVVARGVGPLGVRTTTPDITSST